MMKLKQEVVATGEQSAELLVQQVEQRLLSLLLLWWSENGMLTQSQCVSFISQYLSLYIYEYQMYLDVTNPHSICCLSIQSQGEEMPS